MPHVSEARAASHDRHDLLLVAALAAGDLAGTELDQAISMTTACAGCATLRDDLVALARATSATPPPYPAPAGHDFRLTAADAARLRPTGWRRLADAIAGSRSALTRPLGAGLATLGIAGLLLGNVSLGLAPSTGTAPAPAAAGNPTTASDSAKNDVLGAAPAAASAAPAASVAMPAPSAAASMGVALGPATQPGASDGARASEFAAAEVGRDASANPENAGGGAASPGRLSETPNAAGALDATIDTRSTSTTVLNLVFAAAVVIGLGLLGWSFVGRRRTV